MTTLHIGNTIRFISKTDSTNKHTIREIADNEIEDGTVFLAYEQTEGRGQMKNRWESEAGKNLTFSIFLRPDFLPVNQQFMISKVVCLGLKFFLQHHVNDPITVKWPNDIYVNDKKICGILIENAVMNKQICYSVVGIGLNINQVSFHSDLPNPVSLKIITGKDYNTDELLTELLYEIDSYYTLLKTGLTNEIDSSYVNSLYMLGTTGMFRDKDRQFCGTIKGINNIGQLIVEDVEGVSRVYQFKEVEFLH